LTHLTNQGWIEEVECAHLLQNIVENLVARPSHAGMDTNATQIFSVLLTRKDKSMKRKLAVFALCLVVAAPLLAQKKEEERLANSTKVLQETLGESGLPKNILDQAVCVLVYPSVKKVAFGIGASYGRGVLVCRKGAKMDGEWGAPVMYSLDQGSLGFQLGSTATDFVLVVTNQKAADQILSGKIKLGSNAAAAAGPTGAQAASFKAKDMKADVLTYSRSKGLFAGVSLSGASMEEDKDANKSLYGKEIGVREIVTGSVPAPAAAKPLVSLLDKTSPALKSA
jgi:SH3 domain-containing YSC84-like protein 1